MCCRSLAQDYKSEVEEIHRHNIWQANRKYVDEHNANADSFGYTLAMNAFGDLVSYCLCCRVLARLCLLLRAGWGEVPRGQRPLAVLR